SYFSICALEVVSDDIFCPSSETLVEVHWGIDRFEANPTDPIPGQETELSWEVVGVDRLRLLEDGVVIFDHGPGALQEQGSHSKPIFGDTTFVLEAHSLGRVVQETRLVRSSPFTIEITAP